MHRSSKFFSAADSESVGHAGEAELGKLREYSVDMIPKFIMAGGQLVKVAAPAFCWEGDLMRKED